MNDHLYTFLKTFDDDTLSDGAWWAKLEDGVKMWNKVNDHSHDPHITVSEYTARVSDETPVLLGFYCPKCLVKSETVSPYSSVAPKCCDGVVMTAHEIKDYHAWTASRIFKKGEKDITSTERRAAKVVNYAELFGGTYTVSIDDQSNITIEEDDDNGI